MRIVSGLGRAMTVTVAATVLLVSVAGPASAAMHSHNPNFAGVGLNVAPATGMVNFTLPALTCDDTDAGVVPNLLFTNFTSEDFTGGGVYVQCLGGAPTYSAYEEINNNYSFITPPLAAGDKIRVSISTSATATSVTVADTTTNATVSVSAKGPGDGGSFTGASVGDVKIGSPGLPIPQFTTLTFSGLKINGAKVPVGDAFTPADMYDGTTLQILSGKLSGGGKLTTTFVHA
jgi:Peptidase A4 family